MGKNAVVIVAAGRGERLGGEAGPKQYRLINGQALLQHTIGCFVEHPKIDAVVVVIHADDARLYKDAVRPNKIILPPVIGGATRQASCRAGVEALAGMKTEYQRVLIHDAARPFVTHQTIDNVLDGISDGICTLPASPVADTVKRATPDGMVRDTLNRSGLYLAQTPQGFMLDGILDAHKKAAGNATEVFTDDAAVAEWAGLDVKLVKGNRDNFKITTLEDLEAAQARMFDMNAIADIRTGNGYDIHTLGPGKSVILCGIEIPHDKSLQGHSDADVGLHSLTDALLGTVGEGDIGSHFPPTDPQWKGASSDRFLEHAAILVARHGGTITNLDVTIVCEAPKIDPHREKMRKRIAAITGTDLKRVSVKATTNEKTGAIGREEGIAAVATATVAFSSQKGNHDG